MLLPVYFGVSVKRYPRKRIETEKLVFLLALARHSSRLCVVCWKGGPQVSVASPVGVVMYLGFISWRANVFFLTLMGITLEYYLSYFRTEFVLLIHILYLEVVFFFLLFCSIKGLPMWPSGKESACQCRRCVFDPWVKKNPWRRKWQPTQVFLPGKFHQQKNLVDYSTRNCKESDTAEQLSTCIVVYFRRDRARSGWYGRRQYYTSDEYPTSWSHWKMFFSYFIIVWPSFHDCFLSLIFSIFKTNLFPHVEFCIFCSNTFCIGFLSLHALKKFCLPLTMYFSVYKYFFQKFIISLCRLDQRFYQY